MQAFRHRFGVLSAALLLGACSGAGGGSGAGGSQTGGGTGGATGTGGGSATGGTTGSGGVTGSGGATGTGGATGKGGVTGTGGGAGAKGGATGTGGAAGGGGTTGTGGATTTDGGTACAYQPPSEFIYARWPMPNPASAGLPNPSSYSDNGDGTVTDNVTKLVWQKSVTSSQAYSWCDAINYCATLTLAGRTWRLPTRIELLSLVDFTHGGAIDKTAFPGLPGGKYHWTSSPWVVSQIATKPQYSWIVNFSEGLTSNAGDRTQAEYARCVSTPDEGALPSPRYTSVATGEVQDVDTGLIWATTATTTTTDFATAQTTCSGLGLNGHTWRTPSIKELSTLVDEVPPISKVSPAIDTTTFAGTAATTPYWSSTLFEGMSATAHDPWVINYEDGFTEYNQTAALVRCVR
jgi:hypothetical protein